MAVKDKVACHSERSEESALSEKTRRLQILRASTAICHSEGETYAERVARRVRPRNLLYPLSLVLIAAIAAFALSTPAQAQQTERAKELSQKLLCVCGCNQTLAACNHIDCKFHYAMLKEVDERVARGESDDLILQDFVQEYGLKVLAEPPDTGFDRAAWIMPIIVPIAGFALVWFLIRRWRARAVPMPAGGVPPEMLARIHHDVDHQDDL